MNYFAYLEYMWYLRSIFVSGHMYGHTLAIKLFVVCVFLLMCEVCGIYTEYISSTVQCTYVACIFVQGYMPIIWNIYMPVQYLWGLLVLGMCMAVMCSCHMMLMVQSIGVIAFLMLRWLFWGIIWLSIQVLVLVLVSVSCPIDCHKYHVMFMSSHDEKHVACHFNHLI